MSRASFLEDAGRFLIAGGINTALTSLVYFLCLMVMPSPASYTLSWLAGLAFVMYFYPTRVFPGGRSSTADRLLVGASVVGVFLVGLVVLWLLRMALEGSVLPFLGTLATTTALNFLVSRWLVRRPQ
jgi:putative flippase GtrA